MKAVGKSHIGKVRANNEDQFAIIREPDAMFALVCDGIGGHAAGERASNMVANHFKQHFKKHMPFEHVDHIKEYLTQLIKEANELLLKAAQADEKLQGMGTTLVGIYVSKEFKLLVNAGDSRCYGFSNGRLALLSEDHSYVNQLIKMGRITKKQAQLHPYRNMLTNALGIAKEVSLDFVQIKDDFDLYLLSSDGLHGYVKDDVIESIFNTPKSITYKSEQLIEAANEAGGYDNTTIVLIALDDHHD